MHGGLLDYYVSLLVGVMRCGWIIWLTADVERKENLRKTCVRIGFRLGEREEEIWRRDWRV
jgi:hypothetical protein